MRVVSQSVSQPRFHRVECVIYPTKEEDVSKKSASVLKSDIKYSKSPITLFHSSRSV